MKAEKKTEIVLSELEPIHWYELIYVVISMVVFFAMQLDFISNIPDSYRGPIAVFIFGILHVLASNILTFFYNLSWIIQPWSFRLNATFLKILGAVICTGVIIHQII